MSVRQVGMGLHRGRLIQRGVGAVEEVENDSYVVPEDRWVVVDGNQVDRAGSLDLEDHQNNQEEVAHKVGILDQGRKHQEVVHSLYQTGQGGNSHQIEVERNPEERRGHHVEVLMEEGRVEMHSEMLGKGQLKLRYISCMRSLGEEGVHSEGRQRKSPHGFAH